MRRVLSLLVATALLAIPALTRAAAPEAINYQGILLAAGGAPENGERDMIFHFYDAAGGGEILKDLHTAADRAPVTVSGGMFSVQLGTGLILDGSGAFPGDPYASLTQVFRDFSEVLLQIEIRVGPAGGSGVFESLSPMTRVVSAAWALNAGLVDGREASDFIDRSSAPQTKTGDLTVANLTASGNTIAFSSAGASLTATGTSFFLNAGDQDTDNIFLTAGNGGDDGQIVMFGDGPLDLRAGSGLFRFFDGASTLERGRLDALGNLQIDGDALVSGNDITFGNPGASITARPTGLTMFAGDADTDDMTLVAGNSGDDGWLLISGDGPFEMRSGNGEFSFVNGVSGTESAHLGAAGHLQLDGQLTLAGGHRIGWGFFGIGMQIDAAPGASLDILSDQHVTTYIDADATSASDTATWCANGGCSGANTLMELQEDGDLRIGGFLSQNQFDLAESYLAGEPLEPGDVVRLHPARVGAVLKSAGPDDTAVIGVVSGRPGIVLGGAPFGADRLERMWGAEVRERFERQRGRLEAAAVSIDPTAGPGRLESLALESFYRDSFVPVALAGRVPVSVDGRFGAIAPGDRLAASPVPGVAMRADGRGPAIGIALEPFSGGRGQVEAFVIRGDAHPGCPWDSTGSPSVPPAPAGAAAPALAEAPVPARDGGSGIVRPDGAEVAQLLPISEPVEPGDVLAADPDRPGRFRPARLSSDPAVVGVVASHPGILLGGGDSRVLAGDPVLASQLEEARLAGDTQAAERLRGELRTRFAAAHAPVAIAGIVPVKADATYGAIRPGDLLAASPTPGHARRSERDEPGTVLGKALEPLESGTGLIRMMVMPG